MENTNGNIQLCYRPEGDGFYLTGFYFTDINMLYRFGEWLAVMNEKDSFLVYNYDTDQFNGVELNAEESFIDKNNKEVVDQDTVDSDQVEG